MRRICVHVLSVIRWPSMALAFALMAVCAASHVRKIVLRFPVSAADAYVGVRSGGLEVWYYPNGERAMGAAATARWDLSALPLKSGALDTLGWRMVRYRTPWDGGRVVYSALPLWPLAVLLLLLSWLGYVARWRWLPRKGECVMCFHELHGSAVCPECGRPGALA